MKISKIMSIWRTWSNNLMKEVQKNLTVVRMTLSTGDAATRCGRLPLQPVAAELSLWQSVLPGMTLPVSGLK